jgi:hypothetical protein
MKMATQALNPVALGFKVGACLDNSRMTKLYNKFKILFHPLAEPEGSVVVQFGVMARKLRG